MSQTNPDPAPWVLAAVDALNRHESWTGRIHIHKHLFITQVLKLAKPPFDFVLYDYGPYSFEIDEKIVDLEMFGYLNRTYPKPGYGPRYEPTVQGRAGALKLPPTDLQAIQRVAKELRNRNSQQLELIATCLWMEHRSHISDARAITRRVKQVKPKYDEGTISRSLAEARGLVGSLAS